MSRHTRTVPSALQPQALAPLRADPASAAILLDIDGTLAPIVEHAENANVPEGTRHLLIALARRYGMVACVSGRRASEARAMVSIGTISYIGSHGAELLRAGWTEPVLDPLVEDWARRVQDFGRETDTPDLRRWRVRIEDKGPIIAFHWRGAPDEDGARVVVDAIAKRAEEAGFRTHWGRKVLEVRPPVRIDKGAGITAFLEGTSLSAVLYVGDDVTDVDAFRALEQMAQEGQVTHVIRVGVLSDDGPPEIAEEADVTVEGTEGVRELLAMLIAD
jgi:trehalose 6-phosphate phosphatase